MKTEILEQKIRYLILLAEISLAYSGFTPSMGIRSKATMRGIKAASSPPPPRALICMHITYP